MTARSGRICVMGRANTGKSTLINALLGRELLTVTHRPQTTRKTLAAPLILDEDRLILVDTPGLHRHRRHENRLMNRAALASSEGADVVLALFDRTIWRRDDEYLQRHCAGQDACCIAVINKMDLLRDRAQVLPRIAQLHDNGAFDHVVPLSAVSGENLEMLQELLRNLLSEDPVGLPDTVLPADINLPADTNEFTDEYLITEAVREQTLLRYRKEVPHDIRLELERMQRRAGGIQAVVRLLVRREGQKLILLGRGGGRLQAVGRAAEVACSERLQTKVSLELDVQVVRRRRNARQ